MPHHLIALVGRSPAVVTEVLWALAFQLEEPVIVSDISLISTQGCIEELRQLTADPDAGLQLLARSYPEAMPWPVPRIAQMGQALMPIEDVVSNDDATIAANTIHRVLRRALSTRDDDDVFHVVIAGGRKTMSALALSSFQLYAGFHDRLWHVVPRGSDPVGWFPDVGTAESNPERCGFELQQIPAIVVGDALRTAKVDLDRPFDDVLADMQQRLSVAAQAPRLELDFAGVGLRFKDVPISSDRTPSLLAVAAFLHQERERDPDDGWVPAGDGLLLDDEQAFRWLRWRSYRAGDPLGPVAARGAEARRAEVDKVLADQGKDRDDLPKEIRRLASELDNALKRAGLPPLTRSDKRGAEAQRGTYRRLQLEPDQVVITGGPGGRERDERAGSSTRG